MSSVPRSFQEDLTRVGAPNRRLIDIRAAAAKAGVSVRHWLRLCDDGLAPFGFKLRSLRRWDETAVDEWIAGGCKPVRLIEEGTAHG